MNKMSIIIPCFNKWNFTSSALKDLSFLDPELHEIIVVDNGSSDETGTEIQKYQKKFSNLKYIRNIENRGFSRGCNIGYANATGNFIMFLNNDIRVHSNFVIWTDVYFTELAENSNQLISPTGGFVDPKKGFQFAYETNGEQKFNYLSGWMLIGTREIFDKLILPASSGPFNEEFHSYFEDTDLSFRAIKLGVQLKIISNNSVGHFGKITSKQLNTGALYSKSKQIFSNIWKEEIQGN